ncbi:MAG TPA: hypothetical protein VK575_12955 [Gemmatimonadaceae bacterium]|nr:hypothetical protein [Gemmatimonadaceae bacterium]
MTARYLMLTLALLPIAGCGRQDQVETKSDSAFAALQQRGETAMGVNQYTSQHVFEPLPNGGRIVLQREASDSVGVAAIRAHMDTISKSFGNGDFAVPGFVHAMGDVPGTAAMKRLKAEITYTPQDLPGGAQVVISTRNPQAISAIHEFLAFQRMDHRAGKH